METQTDRHTDTQTSEKTNLPSLRFPPDQSTPKNTPYQRTSKPLQHNTKKLLGRRWANKTNPFATMSKHAHRPKVPSPTNAANFPSEGWATKERPIRAVVSGQQNNIMGYKDYYFLHEHILRTCAFSTSVVASTINNCAYPPGSTELDNKTRHNYRMPRTLYRAFCDLALGLPSESWANTCLEAAFRNMLLQDLDTILHYYAIIYTVPAGEDGFNEPILLPGDQVDMARILSRLMIPLIGANACTPHIINLVWGENEDARLALGGPCGDLSLICRHLLTLSKIVINTIYIWTTDPKFPVLKPNLRSFQYLPPTLQTILLHSREKFSYNCNPVPSGTASAKLLITNLHAHIFPDTATFEGKATYSMAPQSPTQQK